MLSDYETPSSTTVEHRRRGITSRRYTVALIVSDYVAGWAGFILGLVLLNVVTRNDVNHLSHFSNNLRHAIWFPVGVVVGMALTSGYRLSRRSPTESSFTEIRTYATSVSIGGLIALTVSYVAHHFVRYEIQVPTQVIVAIGTTTIVVALARAALRVIVLTKRPVRVIVIDDGDLYQRIATHVHLERGLTLVGRVATTDGQADALGHIRDVEHLIATYKIDRAIFGSMRELSPEVERWYRRTAELLDTAVVPRMFEVVGWRSRLTEMSGLPMLDLAPRQYSRFDLAMKRAFDLLVALVALVVTLPVTLLIVLAIKLTSSGPVFFIQERLGRDRRPFRVLKFRTMLVAREDQPRFEASTDLDAPLYVRRNKLEESNRVTRVGRVLRRTGLDELPQFLNVVLGSMSVVGPRPFVPSESTIDDSHYARRFEVRPGITGLWQVSGRNNLTDTELRQLDFLYVSAWSLWWDVKICFDTPRAMLRGLGAY